MEKVGATSPSWFNDLVKERINLSGTLMFPLIKLLKLKIKEADYFENLVKYDHAASLEEKNRYMARIMSFKELKMDVLGKEKFEYFGKWYYAVIRELLFFYDFKGDYALLAKKLTPNIRKEEAKSAIELLLTLGIIKKQAGGIYRPTSEILIKDSNIRYLHMANFMRAHIELGVEAFDRFPKEKRDLSAMTISISPEVLPKIKEELTALRRKILDLVDEDKSPSMVYQCNVQLFPTTQ